MLLTLRDRARCPPVRRSLPRLGERPYTHLRVAQQGGRSGRHVSANSCWPQPDFPHAKHVECSRRVPPPHRHQLSRHTAPCQLASRERCATAAPQTAGPQLSKHTQPLSPWDTHSVVVSMCVPAPSCGDMPYASMRASSARYALVTCCSCRWSRFTICSSSISNYSARVRGWVGVRGERGRGWVGAMRWCGWEHAVLWAGTCCGVGGRTWC